MLGGLDCHAKVSETVGNEINENLEYLAACYL